VYTAWVSESDQRAATTLIGRMPARPVGTPDPVERAKLDPRSPYERIAAALRVRILDGAFPERSHLPTVDQIAADHGVAVGTAHRATALLAAWGLIEVARGRRAVVLGASST